MNEVSMRPWRHVSDHHLQRWLGGQLLGRAQRIAARGRVPDLVRTREGEAVDTLHNADGSRTRFAGVVMEQEGKRRVFHSVCTCERTPCDHAAAVAVALRNAVRDRRTPPLMAKEDRRTSE